MAMAKARKYWAKAAQCEERAKKARNPSDRDWQMVLARAFRMLAEAETEAVARPQRAAA